MRPPVRILAIAAWQLACAARYPTAAPVCPAQLRPLPAASCELDEAVADYKRDTVLTLWGYVGSQAPRLPIVIELDDRARVDSVCLEEGASVGSRVRQQLDRAIRTLRAMPPAPACLAGTRLELGEDFAEASRGWRGREHRQPRVEELCSPGLQSCAGWQDPVCALLSDGSRETYPDACQACRDPAVTGYDEGRCPWP
jgi:hypothetical protein